MVKLNPRDGNTKNVYEKMKNGVLEKFNFNIFLTILNHTTLIEL